MQSANEIMDRDLLILAIGVTLFVLLAAIAKINNWNICIAV